MIELNSNVAIAVIRLVIPKFSKDSLAGASLREKGDEQRKTAEISDF